MTVLQQAYAIREAMDKAGAVLDQEQALSCVRLYAPWQAGRDYTQGTYLTHGTNAVGDPQLYVVLQDHKSQADWLPDLAVSLYKALGLDDGGYPVWSQPTGAHDAYDAGDIVNYQGTLYKSKIDGNVYSPKDYPGGWEVIT